MSQEAYDESLRFSFIVSAEIKTFNKLAMKRFITSLFLTFNLIILFAQTTSENTLKFLGHPIDGNKSQMEAHLKKRGFSYDNYSDCFKGKFNGKRVEICISTNNNKVDRVYVLFPTTSESEIRYEYNKLIYQFNRNNKYIYFDDNEMIPEKENIDYEMSINNKRYESLYYLKPQIDTLAFIDEFITKYTEKEREQFTEEDVFQYAYNKIIDLLTGCVWFTIHQIEGKYSIGLYYDNLNNRPNGEDL